MTDKDNPISFLLLNIVAKDDFAIRKVKYNYTGHNEATHYIKHTSNQINDVRHLFFPKGHDGIRNILVNRPASQVKRIHLKNNGISLLELDNRQLMFLLQLTNNYQEYDIFQVPLLYNQFIPITCIELELFEPNGNNEISIYCESRVLNTPERRMYMDSNVWFTGFGQFSWTNDNFRNYLSSNLIRELFVILPKDFNAIDLEFKIDTTWGYNGYHTDYTLSRFNIHKNYPYNSYHQFFYIPFTNDFSLDYDTNCLDARRIDGVRLVCNKDLPEGTLVYYSYYDGSNKHDIPK